MGFRAMNCEMAAWVVAAEPQAAKEHLVAARDFIQTVEAQLSRFRPQSELSRLNARSGQPVRVSALLWDVIVCALDSSRRTDGLYDPTVLNALETAGYNRTFETVVADRLDLLRETRSPGDRRPSPTAGHLEKQGPQWSVAGGRRSFRRDIQLDPRTRSVTLPPGVRLDLGGIAKGWTADRAADRLAALGPCLVDAGGDLAARGRPPGQAGWPIGVADPHNPEMDLALLLVSDRGVATSGVDYRRWTHAGVPQHHAIDPRTRRPARTDLLSVTVVGPDATRADLHALVALLLGAKQGHRYLARRRDVEGLLVGQGGRLLVTPGMRRHVSAE